MKIKRTGVKLIAVLALLGVAAAVIAYPERYVKVCLDGVLLWGECVLPSLFPFMVISSLLIKLGAAETAAKPLGKAAKIFKLSPSAAPLFLMSAVSGYPAGSRLVADYRRAGLIDDSDVEKLALLCSTSGPLFIIGSVGYKMFASRETGLILFAAHLLAVTIIALAFSLSKKPCAVKPRLIKKQSGNILYEAFYGSVTAVLCAGGFICFFYTVSAIAADFNLLLPLRLILDPLLGVETSEALCRGIIEATGGCAQLGGINSPLSAPLAGFLITFGGFSIIAQQLSYLSEFGVKPARFMLFKLAQGALCFALTFLFLLIQ